jgi:hypothetical protein
MREDIGMRGCTAWIAATFLCAGQARADFIRANLSGSGPDGVFEGSAQTAFGFEPFDPRLGRLQAVHMNFSWSGGASSTFEGELSDFDGAGVIGRLELETHNDKRLFSGEVLFGAGFAVAAGEGLITVSDGNSRFMPVKITDRLNYFFQPHRTLSATYTGLFSGGFVPGEQAPCGLVDAACTLAQRVVVHSAPSPIVPINGENLFGPLIYEYTPRPGRLEAAVPEPCSSLLLGIGITAGLVVRSPPGRLRQ